MIVVHQVIVQQVARMAIAIHVQVLVRLQIAANVVTVRATRAQVQIVEIVVRLPIDQRVVHTVTEIHARLHGQVPIVQQVVHTVIVTPVRHRVQAQIVASAVTVHAIHAHLPIVHAEKTHTVAIAHALAMTATHVRLRVTANAAVDQIVPEVVFPMIAKNVHAAELAKSA